MYAAPSPEFFLRFGSELLAWASAGFGFPALQDGLFPAGAVRFRYAPLHLPKRVARYVQCLYQQKPVSETPMYPLSINAQSRRWTLPADMSTCGRIRDRECSMRVEAIGPSRIVLRTQQPINPLEQIELGCFIHPAERPIFMGARVDYVEKTWAGYWVDAVFYGMSSQDKERLDQFLAKGADSCADTWDASPFYSGPQRPQLLTLGNSLPTPVRNALQEYGFILHQAQNMTQARHLLARRLDIVVADNSVPAVNIFALCQRLNAISGAPDLLCLVEYATDQEVDEFLNAGAARIVLKPSNHKTLIERIMTTLAERTELQTAAYASAATLSAVELYSAGKSAVAATGMGFWGSLRDHLRGILAQTRHAT